MKIASRSHLVYFALPIDLYYDADYSARLAQVRAAFPAAEWKIVEPARTGWTPEQWRQTWNDLRDRLTALVVWPRSDDNSIGYGCLKEIEDAQERGILVYVINEAGTVLPLKSINRVAGVDRKPALWHCAAFVEAEEG
jgi:hypothetical protein